jgi:CubicO group peptidase (beta-lactamase class C family)
MATLHEAVQKRAAELAADYLASSANVGLTIGAVVGEERFVFGFGKVRRESEQPPDEHTVFEIASVTKVFTATLLAEMAHRGEVRLDQPVAELLPEGAAVPAYRGRQITLAHLSEHTSSLPRLPGNLYRYVKDEANPYKDYEVQHLYGYLLTATIGFPPGSGVEYSNLGTGLLGHALGLKAGKPFDELLAERVLHPLGMRDTAVALSDDQKARMAQGHNEQGEPTSNWDTPALGGAGALRSTVGELLTFLQANLDPAKSPLRAALEACHADRPVEWWRRIPVGAPTALLLAAVSLLIQWWGPVPPGSWKFAAALVAPVVLCLVWTGFWSGVTASIALWVGSALLWGPTFGKEPAALVFLAVLGAGAWLGGYLPQPLRVMLGWHRSGAGGARVWWHNGGTGGFASFVAFARGPNVAVAVLSNSANDVDGIGVNLLEHLQSASKANTP